MASVAVDDRSFGPGESASRLFEEHSVWLLRYCASQLGGGEDAEDAVQTTFLYAFRALRRGVVPECERAWLTTIARNVCHSQRRTADRHPEATGVDLERIALAQPDVEEVGFMDDVRAALSSLPETQRRALVRREWQGVPSTEIATELQLTEPATHALLFRARRSFTTAMTASRRPVAGLNVALLIDQLRTWAKPLFGGAAAKAAVVTAAAGVAVGGVVIEERRDDGLPPAPVVPTLPAGATTTSPLATVEPREKETRTVTREPEAPGRVLNGASRPRATAPTAPRAGVVDRAVRPPRPAGSPAPVPPALDAPSPSAPAPAPVAPPAPELPPVELPPIATDEPPVELPPAIEELVPPVEVPPLPPLPPLPPPPGLPLP